jgi:hypothetical protein
MKVSILLTSIVLVVSSIASSSAREEKEEEGNPTSPTICSCSPTEFEFVLNLDQECTIVTKYRESINGVRQQQQGNDVIFESNPGLAGSFCTVDQNVVVPTATSEGDEDEDDAEDEPLRRRSLQGQRTYTPTYSPTPEVKGQGEEEDIPTPVLVGDEDGEEEEDDDDPVIEVVSIQFLEFDTSDDLTVINQDNTYANVSLASGKRIKFTSVSSFLDTTIPIDGQMDSPSLVPGGASLILYGKTESGRVVRNRFFWSYTMDCENVPVTVGNKLGWVEVVSSVRPFLLGVTRSSSMSLLKQIACLCSLLIYILFYSSFLMELNETHYNPHPSVDTKHRLKYPMPGQYSAPLFLPIRPPSHPERSNRR